MTAQGPLYDATVTALPGARTARGVKVLSAAGNVMTNAQETGLARLRSRSICRWWPARCGRQCHPGLAFRSDAASSTRNHRCRWGLRGGRPGPRRWYV